jgi:hypothetical protein
VVEALATAVNADGGDGSLPDTMEELEALSAELEDVEGYAGDAVSEDDAKTHLATTQTKELLAGKTFYVVANEDNEGWEEFEVHFNNDVTTLSNGEGNENITITGNRMIFNDDTDGSYTIVTPMADYILFDDRNADGSKDGEGHYLFTDRAKAQEFVDSHNEDSAESVNTKDILVQNPWYVIEYTDTETYCNGKFTFGSDFSLTVSYIENGQTATFNGEYSIDENDALVTVHDGKREVETVISVLVDSITTNKIAYDETTGELKNEMSKIYFKDYDDVISFGNSRGVDCSQEISR